MRFRITRTSNYDGAQPCDEAYTLSGEDDPSERRCDWCVDIGTLEELLAFSQKYGELILNVLSDPSIEIYDTWREA